MQASVDKSNIDRRSEYSTSRQCLVQILEVDVMLYSTHAAQVPLLSR